MTVGPKYEKPSTPAPPTPAFKEEAGFKEGNGWKKASPQDDKLKGSWWEIFGDPELNALEEQVNINNQNIAQAAANYRFARAAVAAARAGYYPTVTTAPGASTSRAGAGGKGSGEENTLSIPFSATWEPDIWGQVRRQVEAAAATAQASAATLANARLSAQATLASDYFGLHGLDGQKQLLDTTVSAYEKALQLTINRYNQGIASQVDVVQAQTQLETARAQSIALGEQRAVYEHAIAVLIGEPPAVLNIPVAAITAQLPEVPLAVPSVLLERRPDIAQSERAAAAANANIGVALAAFYPTINLSASAGIQGSSLLNLFTWPARFWSLGGALNYTIFDAGKRWALTDEAWATYDADVANYRQTVLTAFQNVEDQLSDLNILADQAAQQDIAVKAAEKQVELTVNQYKGGITVYLTVITAQAAALANEQTAVNIFTERMNAAVNLVLALGGGWDNSQLPDTMQIPKNLTHSPALNRKN